MPTPYNDVAAAAATLPTTSADGRYALVPAGSWRGFLPKPKLALTQLLDMAMKQQRSSRVVQVDNAAQCARTFVGGVRSLRQLRLQPDSCKDEHVKHIQYLL